ncbi:MAG: hypothetical protein D3917_13910 [Candidatus Electrothrix sp. AX5]|nr:hypothetical protein [Candidatus Electrothrix sp. AX5]
MRDFEAWEDYADFHDRQDWPGLVAYCEEDVAQDPDDLHGAERLAVAYFLNGDYEKAIEFASQIHQECPEIPEFQDRILDALFALGKTEDDFEWTDRPTVVRLSPDVANICYDYLRPKRKSRDVVELSWELRKLGYLAFTEHELLEYLQLDSRFVIDGNSPMLAEISVQRKTKSRTKG